MTSVPQEDWYPVASGVLVELYVTEDRPVFVEEEPHAVGGGAINWGVQLHGFDSSPGYPLSDEIVRALRSDGQPLTGHGQTITPERLNAAAERAAASTG